MIVGVVLGLLGLGGLAGVFWYYGRDLPDVASLRSYEPPQTTRVLTSSPYFRHTAPAGSGAHHPTADDWRTLPEHLKMSGWLTIGMGKLFPSNNN